MADVMSVDEMCAVLDQAKSRIGYLERELEATRKAQRATFELYAAARDGIYNFQCADTDSQFLRDAAEKIDCGHDCRYSSYDASCNAHECSRMEKPEGCDAWLATQLKELADAFDARRAARPHVPTQTEVK